MSPKNFIRVCAKDSIRTVRLGKLGPKPRAGLVCCPKKYWKRGRCKIGKQLFELRSAFANANVAIPRAHLREDIREARSMIRGLARGIRRDRKALRRK